MKLLMYKVYVAEKDSKYTSTNLFDEKEYAETFAKLMELAGKIVTINKYLWRTEIED